METLLSLQALTLTFYCFVYERFFKTSSFTQSASISCEDKLPFFVYKETSINSSFLLFLTSKEIKEEGYFSSFDNSFTNYIEKLLLSNYNNNI